MNRHPVCTVIGLVGLLAILPPAMAMAENNPSSSPSPTPTPTGSPPPSNVGGCTPETNAAFCVRLDKTCGAVTAEDNCGNLRSVSSCGGCEDDNACTDEVCTNNRCVRTNNTDDCGACARCDGGYCKEDLEQDSDCGNDISCGWCAGKGTCGQAKFGTDCTADGEVCTRDICDGKGDCVHPGGNAGTVCREPTNACDPPETCIGRNDTPNCPPDDAGPKASCCLTSAECAAPETCQDHICQCTPKTCAGLDAECGSIGDGCGSTLNCGGCTLPQTCVSNACQYPPLTITTQSLPTGAHGSAYAAQLGATGGSGNEYTWTLQTGSLPAGITLGTTGTFQGTPTVTGTFPFTVTVTDSANLATATPLSLTINPATCAGTMPPNAQLCKDDDSDVGAETPYTLGETCSEPLGSAPKCQTICQPGFLKVGNSCVATRTLTVTTVGTGTGTVTREPSGARLQKTPSSR